MDDLMIQDLTPAEMAETLRGDPREIPITPEHFFAPGLYARKVTLPAGSFVVGEKHKTTHISVLAKGSLLVRGVKGLPDHRMRAGDVMVTPAGSQRAVYAETECVFVCVHHNEDNVRDLDSLRSLFIEIKNLEHIQ